MDIAMQYTILYISIIAVDSIQYEYLKFEYNMISCYNYNSGRRIIIITLLDIPSG